MIVLNEPLQEGIVQEIRSRLEEPEWLAGLRLAARERYDSLPMPVRTDERWRRTDLSGLDMSRVRFDRSARLDCEFGFSDRKDSSDAENLARWKARGFAFGGFSEVLRDRRDRFETPLSEGVVRRTSAALRLMDGGIPADANKFEVLARAVGSDGYAVFVPKDADITIPLRARIVADGADSSVFPRSVVVAEPGSRVTVVEEFVSKSGAGPYFASGLTEIYVKRGAEVTFVSLQDWGAETWNFHTQRFHAEEGGKIVTLSVHLGSAVTKANVEGALVGPHAESRMLGIIFGDRKQHFDLYTLQDHQADATTSDLLFKSALRGQSKSIYSGLIRVNENVIGADAYQANRNLLLSDSAKADSRPMLEILNNDVRCTHGATMGPVDEDQIFYLRSRGLPQPVAERMVVQGFFEEAADFIRDEGARDWIHDRIARQIGDVALAAETKA